MRRAKLPLDAAAVAKADSALKAEAGGRSLSTGPEDAHLRQKWMDAYIEAAGPGSYTDTREERKKTPEPVQACPLNDEKNFVELQYSYADGKGVAGASYEVIDLDTNGVVASGTLDSDGYCYADIPVSTKRVKYNFFNDPKLVKPLIKQPLSNEELSKIEPDWEDRIIEKAKNAGNWTWGVIQGDFNEDPTLGQIATNTVITLIPVVDQAGDVRDITANLKFLIYDKRYNDKWVWFALVITIIGCIPEFGSLLKGVAKVLLNAIKNGEKVPINKLIEVFNLFAKGDAIKYLRELSAKLPEYGNFVKSKLKEILNSLISKLEKASKYSFGELSAKAKSLKESAEQVLASVDKQVDELINEFKKKLDEILNESVDLSKDGGVKTLNERTQVASKPPDIEQGKGLNNSSTPDHYYVEDSTNPRFKAEGRIGNARGKNGSKDDVLLITIRSELDGQKSSLLSAKEEFKNILDHFKGKFSSIKGSWQYGTNLEQFNKYILEGLSQEEAALKTWTGKQASEAGYNKVEILEASGGPPYTNVSVLYTK